MPGGGVALNRLGVADLGLVTLPEMVDSARTIVDSISVPLIADADTGFGNQLNVQRTVREFERVGVSAIHLEDQVFPKRCGHLAGKQVVSQAEAVQKIRAAVAARINPEFLIIARCDALALTGFDDTAARCRAYVEAGADMLFVEGPRSMEEIVRIPREIPGPHLFNMSAGGKVPPLNADELGALGYSLMILPNFSALAAVKAIREVFADIRQRSSVSGVLDRCATFAEFTALGDLATFNEAEREFAVSPESTNQN
jgi:2-methylisocitrate lyase-like PEP mutase family enzyme